MPFATLSLVVATRGRANPFRTLFESLEAQTYRGFEVIVVDQNADARAGHPAEEGWSFPIKHVRTPDEAGLSRARNSGLRAAEGDILLFPDDDCWYPPHFLAHALARMESRGADVLAGRAADEATGRDINGRFETTATAIDRRNVWTTGIEWVVFFRRSVLETVGGYDCDIGVGASTPWQACEGQDVMLRAIAAGFACWFDPAIYGHHAELDRAHPSMIRKGRSYARGLGYVLRIHDYPISSAANWILRPVVRAALELAKGDRRLAQYFASVAFGRLEGWRMKVQPTVSMAPRRLPSAVATQPQP